MDYSASVSPLAGQPTLMHINPHARTAFMIYGASILHGYLLWKLRIHSKNFIKATPHNGARRFGERFWHKRKNGKCGNTGCISHFSYCTIGAKDPPKPAVPTQRCCLKSRIGMIGFGFVRWTSLKANGLNAQFLGSMITQNQGLNVRLKTAWDLHLHPCAGGFDQSRNFSMLPQYGYLCPSAGFVTQNQDILPRS